MSTCDVQASGVIELLFYGELPDADQAEVERHVRSCDECRRAFDDLVTIREVLAARPDITSPADGDWSGFMARLDEAVRHEADRERATVVPVGFRWRPSTRPRRAYAVAAMAAVLTLVTIAVLLALRQHREVIGTREVGLLQPASGSVVTEAPNADADTALRTVGEEHFERSKLVVLGLATKDPGDGPGSNWAYEQELASVLLDDTRLYRMAAEERGMNTLAGVMRDLELVLLEASMSEQPDAESLASLQRLIRRRDLLTKMETVKTSGL